jgi:hypothetical protein
MVERSLLPNPDLKSNQLGPLGYMPQRADTRSRGRADPFGTPSGLPLSPGEDPCTYICLQNGRGVLIPGKPIHFEAASIWLPVLLFYKFYCHAVLAESGVKVLVAETFEGVSRAKKKTYQLHDLRVACYITVPLWLSSQMIVARGVQ